MEYIKSNELQNTYSQLEFAKVGDSVKICAMIHSLRIKKWGGFVVLRKPEGLVQAVISIDDTTIVNHMNEVVDIKILQREMSIVVEGVVNAANIKDTAVKYKDIEIAVKKIQIISSPATTDVIDMNALKFGDEESLLCYKFDNRHVTLRNPRDLKVLLKSTLLKSCLKEQREELMFSRWIISENKHIWLNLHNSTNK